jgi:hypothetical protein
VLFDRPPDPGSVLRVGTLTARGATRWGSDTTVPAGATSVSVTLPPGDSVGLSLQSLAGTLPSHRVVITSAGVPYELGGSLSSALVPGPWQAAGFSQGYAVFTVRRPPVPISATAASGGHVPLVVRSNTTKSEQITVNAPGPTTVIRSVAWDSGWKATVSVNGGAAQSIPVRDVDLVQQVRIPAGRDVVTFHYRPPHLLAASLLTLGALVLLGVLLAVWLVRRRRRPHDGTDVGESAHHRRAGVPAPVG